MSDKEFLIKFLDWCFYNGQTEPLLYVCSTVDIDDLIDEFLEDKENKNIIRVKSQIEKQMKENQFAEIKVLSCNGDAEGKRLPTQILLQLGKEKKWYEQTKLNKE